MDFQATAIGGAYDGQVIGPSENGPNRTMIKTSFGAASVFCILGLPKAAKPQPMCSVISVL